ncbi:hypothetical protein Verru16b_01480 [Lacunisphaera limnophila]|uniref:DUF885 domain-containing protein n=1 Tax=Lacunisphaera limnophila TaxID=1838286 RepID=A0A1D8AU50_9BACT|nr:DUF885 domain-containing protein [Lacunisphaera limnophila]AOS44418.1 hypothetical protein Verru16b_01480 [Lacunisphaera limnophila]
MKFRSLCTGAALAAAITLNLAATSAITREAVTAERIAAESAKANAFFDRVFDESVDRSPLMQGYLGLKKDQDKWDDFSEANRLAELAITVRELAALKATIDFDRLDEQTQMSYRLFVTQAEQTIEGWKWRNHDYVFTQMGGQHTDAPAFLINFHTVETVADARAYIARLRAMPRMFDQLIARAEAQAARGIQPPKFVYPLLIESCREILTGMPFDASETRNVLLEDFQGKVAALPETEADVKPQLVDEARTALLGSVRPAYEKLIALFEAQAKVATDDDGVWKHPEGRDYYNFMLRSHTTTALSADEVHTLGVREVARIHAGMMAIARQTGFTGDLAAFLKFMRDDPQFSYPSTEEGRAAYIQRAEAAIATMTARLDEFFGVKPKAPLVVKKVEPFREKGSAAAFYNQPSADGSRPGIYYVNTHDMRGLPIWELETLAHHEAIPGHHMQIAIAQELENMPKFRRFGGYNAYAEGWALYAEYFPKEFGFYADPYQDFGRLSDELLRAVRLVVDTGVHAKGWTRQQVLDYFGANTAASAVETLAETNRYIVWPGQATGYKVGMLKILELREQAKAELGAKFDLRAYHDLVLKNGALPLNLLEENVRAWIAARKQG